ncbi:hypothetical protein [Legionella donaldsonii]|uniref:hypothetical protein n=1 Tax=Legionella donaldsonii TaxID=45060 RepID=UPI00399D290E
MFDSTTIHQELSTRIKSLREAFEARNDASLSLKDKVINADSLKTLERLETLLANDQESSADYLMKALPQFFAENWTRINEGKAVPYTAQPDSGVTRLLCDLATWVVNEKNTAEINTGKPRKNIELVGVIHVLMPTVSTESVVETYPDLYPTYDPTTQRWQDVDIHKILKTHIISGKGFYLLPVHLLTELDVSSSSANSLSNPYYDYKIPGNMTLVVAAEYNRFAEHSSLAKELLEAKTNYETALSDKSNLLGHLRELNRQLYFNSVHGVGKEENAGQGAYAAITRFMEYYNALGELKAKIPASIKQEIDKLLELASDWTKNLNATENLETCLATRRQGSENAIRGHEIELSAISISGESKAKLIEGLEKTFNTVRSDFISALSALDSKEATGFKGMMKSEGELTSPKAIKPYEGSENVEIGAALIKELNIQIAIKNKADLPLIITLTPNEIREVCTDDVLNQINGCFETVEELVIFCIETPPAKLEALLNALALKIGPKLLTHPQDFASLLISLDSERSQIVVKAFDSQLPQLMTKSNRRVEGLSDLICSLSPEQSTIVLSSELLKKELPGILRTIRDLRSLFRNIEPEQHPAVYEACKDQIPQLIKTVNDFAAVFKILGPVQFISVYDACKDQILQLIKSVQNLAEVLHCLDPKQCAEILSSEKLKSQLPTVESSQELVDAFKGLSPEQFTPVYEVVYKDKIPGLIQSSQDLFTLLKFLSPEKCVEILSNETMKSRLSDNSNLPIYFNIILQRLDETRRSALYEAFKAKLPQWITRVHELFEVMSYLSEDQQTSLYNDCKNIIPRLIKSDYDLRRAISRLSLDQCNEVLSDKELKTRLPQLIHSVQDLYRVLQELPLEKHPLIYRIYKDHIPQLIKSAKDLYIVITMLSTEQCTEVLSSEHVKKQLPQWFESSYNFLEDLKLLTQDKRTAVYSACKDQAPHLIKSAEDFRNVLEFLSPDQRTEVNNACKNLVPQLIKSAKDFRDILEFLSPEQRTTVYEANHEQVHNQVKSEQDLSDILEYLSDNSRNAVNARETLKKQLRGFDQLLVDLQTKKREFDQYKQTKASEATEKLHTNLLDARKAYLSNPKNSSAFKRRCDVAISGARGDLQNYSEWRDILAKLGLALVSAGIIPACLALYKRGTTGSWDFRVFRTSSEDKLDEIKKEVANQPDEIKTQQPNESPDNKP